MADGMENRSNAFYPQTVTFNNYEYKGQSYPGHYSIFMLAFSHNVTWDRIKAKTDSWFAEYSTLFVQAAMKAGWAPHEACAEKRYRPSRAFTPDAIFTPPISESFLGQTPYCFQNDGDEEERTQAFKKFVKQRLSPDDGRPFSEPLLFSLKSELLDKPLRLHLGDPKKTVEAAIVEWADLWLYGDGTGMLAFKVCLSDADKNDVTITRVSGLVRALRHFGDSQSPVLVERGGGENVEKLWSDIIVKTWLGFDKASGRSDVLQVELGDTFRGPVTVFDRFQRYCKVLTSCQMTERQGAEHAVEWMRPLAEPEIKFSENDLSVMSNGEWGAKTIASQRAISAGYATVRDMIPFELVTCSDEGAALGRAQGRKWMYSPEYVRKMVDSQIIEIWEYWSGMCLRDSCVFVAYDDVPIMLHAEARYYPLYAYVYLLRYRLDMMSERIIDHDMSDVVKGRQVRNEFQRFRNQYWFKDVTTEFTGNEIFDKMKAGMEVDHLYDAVKEEISDVSDHVQEKWERHSRMILAALLVLLAPLQSVWDSYIEFFFQNSNWLTKGFGILIIIWLVLMVLAYLEPLGRMLHAVMRWISRLAGRAGY